VERFFLWGDPAKMETLEHELADLETLLARMRGGDREAAATFMRIYGERVRRRVSGKLSSGMRRLFDSQEILSTVTRRLDHCVSKGQLAAAGPEQLWAMVFRIAQTSVVDKGRIYRRLRRTEGPDQEFAAQLRQRLGDAEGDEGAELELDTLLRSLETRLDREVLTGWLRGLTYDTMSEELGMKPEALRKRFERIRDRLRTTLGGEVRDDLQV
jgi:DNA-directed RNA polymerase specialized sigma24 family protein